MLHLMLLLPDGAPKNVLVTDEQGSSLAVAGVNLTIEEEDFLRLPLRDLAQRYLEPAVAALRNRIKERDLYHGDPD